MAEMTYVILWTLLFAGIAYTDATCRDRKDCSSLAFLCNNTGIFKNLMRSFCPKTCKFCSDHVQPTPDKPLPPHKGGCGRPNIKGLRIIGGKAAVRGSWPWQILLLFLGKATCGGTLIAPDWVVTAAHCVFGKEDYTKAFTVRVGEHDTRMKEGSEKDVAVEKIIMHPSWDPKSMNNDIALLLLSKPISFNKYVSPICLPSTDPHVGTTCYITGWGKIQYPGSMAPVLQQGELPIVTNQVCYKRNKDTIPVPITESMICAGSGGASPLSGCHGDSGGPLVCDIDGEWELHGSVSHGSPECMSNKTYTVFSRTHYFKHWIIKQMEDN